jgi:hypothetical protein
MGEVDVVHSGTDLETAGEATTNDNRKLADVKAIVEFVSAQITALGILVGNWDPTSVTRPNNFPTSRAPLTGDIQSGDYWFITKGGCLGGTATDCSDGEAVNSGDVVYCKVDSPNQTTQDPAEWFVVQSNHDYADELHMGLIELATQAEVDAGVDTVRAVTPATLHGYMQGPSSTIIKAWNFTITGNDTITSYSWNVIGANETLSHIQVAVYDDDNDQVELEVTRNASGIDLVWNKPLPTNKHFYVVVHAHFNPAPA